MNLLQDAWMPVRNVSGQREWIAPERLGESQWQAFDADRPDFNGALAQFAIGLLQTTTPATDTIRWRALFREPPSAETLREWFVPVHDAFELDGMGPRFMQDFDLGTEGVAVNDISALLIDSPGENTLKNNADHFVKRGQVRALCPACAALALFTLQVNAPSGGAGHRTGLRGGGPLTTLVLAPPETSLWHSLWLNVSDKQDFLAQAGDMATMDSQRSFPWLGPITTLQVKGGELAQAQVHPAHLFWAMPRRIRLDLEACSEGFCDLCARHSERLVSRYGTKNYGLNYKGTWSHPLSPYYETKDGWLPLHPQPDGVGYRHWMAWVLGASGERKSTRTAAVVDRALAHLHRQAGSAPRLWAFGFDMDKMKVRCWHESTLPLYGLADCDATARANVQAEVGRWLAAAELVTSNLRDAVKSAWFSRDARGDFAYVDASFWSRTEAQFYARLRALIEATRTSAEMPIAQWREDWLKTITRVALRLFDETFVGAGLVERQNPRRAARAHRQLRSQMYGPKLRQAIGLATPGGTDEEAGYKTRKRTAKNASRDKLKESA